DVRLERQRQLDDGTWSEVEVVPPIPGEVDFSDRIASLRPAEWPSLSSELYAAGPAVYQPGFYRLADGREWSRELVEAARPLDEEAQRLVAEVQRAYAQWQSEQQAL